jgi:DNA-nicking Smr family endonuclease
VSGNPFDDLEKIRHSLPSGRPKPERAKGAGGSRGRGSLARPSQAPGFSVKPLNDVELFLQQMQGEGVDPLSWQGKVFMPYPPSPDKFKRPPEPDEDAYVLKALSELVSGAGEFDLSYTDEFQEGHVKGLHPHILRNLKEGRFPIQENIDLHGYTLAEAQSLLATVIPRKAAMGCRTILIIHGRGLRSPDGIPVLKLNLGNLLLRSSIRKYILAFVTALPYDGGTGACYVRLRNGSKMAGKT